MIKIVELILFIVKIIGKILSAVIFVLSYIKMLYKGTKATVKLICCNNIWNFIWYYNDIKA